MRIDFICSKRFYPLFFFHRQQNGGKRDILLIIKNKLQNRKYIIVWKIDQLAGLKRTGKYKIRKKASSNFPNTQKNVSKLFH